MSCQVELGVEFGSETISLEGRCDSDGRNYSIGWYDTEKGCQRVSTSHLDELKKLRDAISSVISFFEAS